MKIVLFALNCSWAHTNLAVRCLREKLEKNCFDVVIIEHTLSDRSAHVLESLISENADVYSFSSYIWNIEQNLDFANSLKQILPDAKVVFGGPEVSFATERFDDMPWIDAIICGEGEKALVELCLRIETGLPFERIIKAETSREMYNSGILYRDGDEARDILYYESSRGCPYSCAYCLSSADGCLRFKDVDDTIRDLEAFEKLNLDYKIIKFVDRTFNADAGRANKIWRALLDERFTKHYHFEICASLLNEESLEILSKFPKGKIQLEIGLQSTNLPTLEASARHLSPDKTIEISKRLCEMGNIHVHLDLIAGLPYESYERFKKSFDDAFGACHKLQLGFLKLLHGTALREKRDEYGYAFLQSPPYTVLQNNWISYGEMQKLSNIAETLERFYESGRFKSTLDFLFPVIPSPFAFFEGLYEFLREKDTRPLQRISQIDAYKYLFEYARDRFSPDDERLKEAMRADYCGAENRNPPSFLR